MWKSRVPYVAALLVLCGVGYGDLMFHAVPSLAPVHASGVWFVSMWDHDSAQAGVNYRLWYRICDSQTMTVMITTDWGDGVVDRVTQTSFDVQSNHTYISIGSYTITVTLSDSFGNNAVHTVAMSVGIAYFYSPSGGVGGGHRPIIM